MTGAAPPVGGDPRTPILRTPILCAVTDRRRLGELSSPAAAADALVLHARIAADAGIDLFQIREPDLPDATLLDVVLRARDATAGSGMRVLINDRLDIAIAAAAAGVHLRGASFGAPRARRLVQVLGPGERPFLLGRSVHSVDEAVAIEAAGGLDYLILGAMFPTHNKPPTHPVAGVEVLSAAVRRCQLPIRAIGGLTFENAPSVARAGAAGLAAIGLFLRTDAGSVQRLRRLFA
jgi:thiamine-phosphate pyrophosphorylase